MFSGWCPDCKAAYYREKRKTQDNRKNKQDYERSVHGMLCVRLSTIKRQGWNIQPDYFFEWAHSDELFELLYKQWRDSGFHKFKAPVVIRLDESKPHSFENCTWVVFRVKQLLQMRKITRDRIAAPTHRQRRSPSSK